MAGTAALGAAVLVFVGAVLPPRARRLAPPEWHAGGPDGPRRLSRPHQPIRRHRHGRRGRRRGRARRPAVRHLHRSRRRHAAARSARAIARVSCASTPSRSARRAATTSRIGLRQGAVPARRRTARRRRGRPAGSAASASSRTRIPPSRRWRGTTGTRRFDGIEWLNADSEWRDESTARLAVGLLTYPFRPDAKPSRRCSAGRRRLPAWTICGGGRGRSSPLPGTDAHARVGWKNQSDPYQDATLLRLPSYEAAFRAFSLHVALESSALTRDAGADGQALVGAIRAGRVHTIVDAYARPGAFEFTGRAAGVDRGDGRGDDRARRRAGPSGAEQRAPRQPPRSVS